MKKIILLCIGLLLSFPVLALDEPPVPNLVRDPLILPPGAPNPNVTQENIQKTICVPNWSEAQRPSRAWIGKLKAKMMKEVKKKLPNAKSSDYELDHDEAISSGGNPYSIDNLWLQPWNDTAKQLGAHSKDTVEKKVHRDICDNKITLEQGRQIFLNGWENEYKQFYTKKK